MDCKSVFKEEKPSKERFTQKMIRWLEQEKLPYIREQQDPSTEKGD